MEPFGNAIALMLAATSTRRAMGNAGRGHVCNAMALMLRQHDQRARGTLGGTRWQPSALMLAQPLLGRRDGHAIAGPVGNAWPELAATCTRRAWGCRSEGDGQYYASDAMGNAVRGDRGQSLIPPAAICTGPECGLFKRRRL